MGLTWEEVETSA